MNAKRMRVRGVRDCAGAWGTLNVGEEKDIEVNIAESLILGGLAEDVFPAGGESDGIAANEASAADVVLQQYAEQVQEQAQAQQREQEEQPAAEDVVEQPTASEQVADEEQESEKKEEQPRRRVRKS